MVTAIRTHLRTALFLNTYLLVIMRVFGAATGFLFWAIAARAMSAEEVGLASGAVSAATLFAGIAQLGLGYGLVRHLSSSERPNALLNLAIVVSGALALALALIYLLTLPLSSPVLLPLRATVVSSVVFVALVVSTTTTQLFHWAFLASRRLSFSLWKMLIQSVLAIILLLALWPLMSGYLATATAYMLSTVIGLALCFWPFLPRALPGYRFSLDFKNVPRISFGHYSLANYLADQLQRAPDTILPLVVITWLGPSAGACFFVVWTFGRSMAAWAGSVAESLFAEGAREPAKVAGHARRAVKLGLLLGGGLTTGSIVGARYFLAIYGPDYVEQGVVLLGVVALAAIPSVLLSIFVSLLRIHDRLRAVSTVMTVSVVSGVLLSVAFLQFGLAGAGVGWLLSQTLIVIAVGVWWRVGGARGHSARIVRNAPPEARASSFLE